MEISYNFFKQISLVLVLDEIDQLESKNQDVLYTVFEWPALFASRLALVGIANTLDLTDRVLPRLQVSFLPTHSLADSSLSNSVLRIRIRRGGCYGSGSSLCFQLA